MGEVSVEMVMNDTAKRRQEDCDEVCGKCSDGQEGRNYLHSLDHTVHKERVLRESFMEHLREKT